MSRTQNWELLYKRAYSGKGGESETPQFIIRVNLDEYNQWKKDPLSVPLVQVVDTFEVFHGEGKSHTGLLERPSNTQLMEAFGSTVFENIFTFMSEHGHLQACGKHGSLQHGTAVTKKESMSGVHG